MTKVKQPYVDWDYDFEFKAVIDPPDNPTGDTIVSAACTADPPDNITLHDQLISGTRVKIWISGGIDGVTYHITCRVVSASSPPRKLENDFDLEVRDL